MRITVDTRNPIDARADLLVLSMVAFDPGDPSGGSKGRLPPRIAAIDRALDGRIGAVIGSGDFRGKRGQTALVYPGEGFGSKRVLLLGLGDESSLDAEALRAAAGAAVGQASTRKARSVAFAVGATRRVRAPLAAQALAEGAVLAGYRFDRYRTKKKDSSEVDSVALSFERAADLAAARRGARSGVILADSQNVARQLSNEPANALPPAALAREAEKVAREVGLHVQVMDVPEMKQRKMGAILAVGQGSANPPRMVVLEHNRPPRRRGKGRSPRRQPTVCIVGKGVTFDSGGISIKPSAGMDEMKHDMSGAASVVGAMRACALLKVPLHVVGVVGAAENMPSGTAYRPGDIITAASKQTIEILNTDAEGRVVLADALHYARTEYNPVAMIDLATLTGACVVALGKWATGLFGNDDRLVEHVRRSGEAAGERAWPMPLWEEHRKAVKSEVADLKNTTGREASSSTAAAFLAAFVGDTPWVHLDIAGTGWTSKGNAYQKRGATGVGVRLVLEALRNWKAAKI